MVHSIQRATKTARRRQTAWLSPCLPPSLLFCVQPAIEILPPAGRGRSAATVHSVMLLKDSERRTDADGRRLQVCAYPPPPQPPRLPLPAAARFLPSFLPQWPRKNLPHFSGEIRKKSQGSRNPCGNERRGAYARSFSGMGSQSDRRTGWE